MVLFSKSLIAFAATVFASGILAHPGHDPSEEIAQQAAYFATGGKRSLVHCSEQLKARGHEERLIARRRFMLEKLRKKKRSLETRDFTSVLNTDHHSTLDVSPESPENVIFAGNNSCILSPDVTEGPYYVSGELVRKNVTEDEVGVPLTFDVQVININTCEPMPGVLLEIWHCNSTGVYGGVVANGNGNILDLANINKTAFRGIQPSDADGVLSFDTIVPGHYTGRTPHIHVLAHLNATLLPNATVSGGTISHVGQLFFDQTLYDDVRTVSPYSENTQALTTNAEDSIMGEEAATSDPVLEYVYLGDSVDEGVFGWIAFGVDPSVNKTVSAAASYGIGGGHANNNTGDGMGGGGGGGPATPASPGRICRSHTCYDA
ncbi:extracellular dioxygenase-like protein [Lophium mytilinum]|uniref:Extracellular dioxygenase-like protein n=1 Tax=Lophium mytilinum TaxID=390894 RepID=A0A6A6QB30_9PEZI|nr:extracellular dioxygenase-like protein [Lophium mytilinum]